MNNSIIKRLFLTGFSSAFLLLLQVNAQKIDFKAFDEGDWEQVREERFPSAGRFIQEKEGIVNFIPPNASQKDVYSAKNGVGFALRLLKNNSFYNGKLELDLMLEGTAAPSIYFRTQTVGSIHKATYNLVVFNHTEKRKNYQGINLWKWQQSWPHKKGKSGWVKLASWIFPVPLKKPFKLGTEVKNQTITVFFNNEKKGTVFDSEALPAGKIGVCAIEGKSHFYKFNVKKNECSKQTSNHP